jgi:hypothetical protein
MHTAVFYAVVDRAVEHHIVKAAEYESKIWCLFPEPVDEDFAKVAPYLITVNDEMQSWLKSRETPWGFSFASSEKPKIIRAHLRAQMNVYIEESAEKLFFRYYDPRILWAVLDSLDNVKLNHFMGPMQTIQTFFPVARETDVDERLAPYRPFGYLSLNPFPLSQAQYQNILMQCERNLTEEVAVILAGVSSVVNHTETFSFAELLVQQLIRWGISAPAHIKTVAELCQHKNVMTWPSFPDAWQTILTSTKHPASYRVLYLQSLVRKKHVV